MKYSLSGFLGIRSPWRYWLVGTVITSVPLSIMTKLMLHDQAVEARKLFSESMKWYTLADLLILAPWLETALMFPLLAALKKVTQGPQVLRILSAGIWSLLHALRLPLYGVTMAWPFYVFSDCLLTFEPTSRNRAWVNTAILHTLCNLLTLVLLGYVKF